MTYATEFPDFDADGAAKIDSLVATGAWEDKSWHNDSCPSVMCDVVEIYIDYLDDDKREFRAEDLGGTPSPRFTIFCEGDEVASVNDWADVLAYINDGKRDFS